MKWWLTSRVYIVHVNKKPLQYKLPKGWFQWTDLGLPLLRVWAPWCFWGVLYGFLGIITLKTQNIGRLLRISHRGPRWDRGTSNYPLMALEKISCHTFSFNDLLTTGDGHFSVQIRSSYRNLPNEYTSWQLAGIWTL